MISCLCVTHERPEFMPWLEHQFYKQSAQRDIGRLIIVDSSEVPFRATDPRYVYVAHVPGMSGIAAKRNAALALADDGLVTWFDDDDWQHPLKLKQALRNFYPDTQAVGSRTALMYSTLTGKCSYYESRYEPIIFNSATYLKSAVPTTFNESLVTGEDTDWQMRFFETKPNFVTLGEPQHAWLCHTKNITNKSSSKFFERECTIPFDPWEREFLAKLHT